MKIWAASFRADYVAHTGRGTTSRTLTSKKVLVRRRRTPLMQNARKREAIVKRAGKCLSARRAKVFHKCTGTVSLYVLSTLFRSYVCISFSLWYSMKSCPRSHVASPSYVRHLVTHDSFPHARLFCASAGTCVWVLLGGVFLCGCTSLKAASEEHRWLSWALMT